MPYTSNFTEELVSLVTDLVSADRMQLSEMLFEQAFATSNLAQQHEVLPGVRTGHKVPILLNNANPDSFPFKPDNNCDITICDVDNEFSSMNWELGLLECRVPICLRSFDENFLRFFNQYRQTQQGEPDLDSAIIRFINRTFTQNLVLAEWRAAYFGDKSSASNLYNGINGFFTQAEANPENVVTIDENAGATFTAQNALTGEAVYNYLIEMYTRASAFPWFDPTQLEFRVTRSMASRYITWLNSLGDKAPMNCDCLDATKVTSRRTFSYEGLTINGIPIRVHGELDTIINGSAELNGGGADAARINPHRAILTFRENLLVGTSEVNALQSFDIWYSKDDKMVYLEGSSYLGAAIPMPTYIVAT